MTSLRTIFSIGFLLLFTIACRNSAKIGLGQLSGGETVSFVRNDSEGWGIDISGGKTPGMTQANPVKLDILLNEDKIVQRVSGYASVKKTRSGIEAAAKVEHEGGAVFHITDHWSISNSVLTLKRHVRVKGNAEGGFSSSVIFETGSSVTWPDVKCFAPGALYGDPTFDGDRSPGGTLNHEAKRFLMREDILPAPLFAVAFSNNSSVAMLNPSPDGKSTVEETRMTRDIMIDPIFRFGSLGAWQNEEKPVEFGFTFPGITTAFGRGTDTPVRTRWIRRFHPVAEETDHHYEIRFRFGSNEYFRDVVMDAWRWAWNTLDPQTSYTDVEQMRRLLIDQLASQVTTIDGRTGIPFVMSTQDTALRQWNWTMIAMGFVGKNLEGADLLLREAERDKTERGQKMHKQGSEIINSMIKALNTVPLQATGYDLATGKPWDHEWLAPWLRNATEDMRTLVHAYQRERDLGRDNPEWFNWVKKYVDWLMLQQREDGSFPRRWEKGTSVVAEPTGTTSYSPVPLLVIMTEETGDQKYLQAAVRAATFVWENWGTNGLFIGGASDNPNITDKEAGMLSLEAFLSLYEATKDKTWLERAKVAAGFAESWIWIWNLPMPEDAVDSLLHWKKGVPTIGPQGITARVAGSVDQYMAWSVPSYAKLYKYTGDEHYLEVARVLLHDTKSMVAIPGRIFDLRGPGWQQEGWRMGPGGSGRGVGGHRFWLPWVTTNHLRGIYGLEEFDQELFKKLSVKTEL
ncbi:MAG: hypothetical protein MUE74_11060 [Bacteroidales bacterium]|nr:hypothetical protein [Bacteroidales bacterium]